MTDKKQEAASKEQREKNARFLARMDAHYPESVPGTPEHAAANKARS